MDQVGVIYARFSSHAQREESIEDQLRECHAFAERNGIRIVEEYCDQALTGKTDARPAFQRMVRDSAKGRFSIVITYKVDRFARNRYDSATYKARLKKNGVRVLYAKETIPDGPEGIILESVLEGYAEYYSANLAQNITRGLEGNALNCRTNGVVVLGYKKSDDDHYEIDETTAPIVREIFEKYAAGVKQMEICEELNARGLRTTRGGLFNKNSLVRILKNRKYIGEYHYMDVTVPGGMPAIISVELFEDVQQKLKRGRRAPSKDWSCADFLLTGKLFCGECGEPMVGTSGHGRSGRKYNYYICGAKKRRQGCKKENVAQDWIEEVVLTYTMEVVLQDDTIQEIADGVMDFLAREAADDGVLVSLEARLAEVKTSVKNLMKAIEAGIITKATTERMMELENERVELEDAIAIEKIKEPEIERDQVVFFLEKFRDGDLNDPAFRLRLVEAFVSSVYLWDDGRIDINYNYTGQGSKVSLDQAADIVSKIAGGDGSDLDSSGPLNESYPNTVGPLIYSGFVAFAFRLTLAEKTQ